jgi:hypothetical protein
MLLMKLKGGKSSNHGQMLAKLEESQANLLTFSIPFCSKYGNSFTEPRHLIS